MVVGVWVSYFFIMVAGYVGVWVVSVFFANGEGGGERERESVGKIKIKIKIKNLLLPLLHVQGKKKKNNVVRNGTISGFSLFFK
jgi:hypothetical protein